MVVEFNYQDFLVKNYTNREISSDYLEAFISLMGSMDTDNCESTSQSCMSKLLEFDNMFGGDVNVRVDLQTRRMEIKKQSYVFE